MNEFQVKLPKEKLLKIWTTWKY